MLTARGRPEDVLKGFAAGADDYLPKPFDLNILLARIQSLLRRREWSRTLVTDPPNQSRVAEPKTLRIRRASLTFIRLPASRWISARWSCAPTARFSA